MRTAVLMGLFITFVFAGDRPPERLLADLESPDYQVRRRAVLAVEGRTEPGLLEKVLAMAEHDEHPNIRGTCADVLGTFRDARVFPVLAKMAAEDRTGPRERAFVALGRLGDPRCRKILRAALAGSHRSAAYAAKGLGLHGDPEDFPVLAEFLLAQQRNPFVAEFAAEALVGTDGPRAREFLRERFVALAPYARRKAGEQLAKEPGPELRAAMIACLASKDRLLRHAAIEVLGLARDAEAAPALVDHLDGLAADRAVTVVALGRIGADSAAPALRALLADTDAGLRAAAAHALGLLADRASGPAIALALKTEKEGIPKIRMIEALGRLGDDRAIPTLIPFLDDATYVPQPQQISSIRTFPWNVHVHATAAWAILTLRDGKEPFAVGELVSFPGTEPPDRTAGDIAAIKAWWAER